MIAARDNRPGPLTIRLLRLQYWYDRLSEPRRLLVGLATIAFLGACLLYVLGLTSQIMVSRMELPTEQPPVAVQASSTAIFPVIAPTQAPGQPPPPTALSTPTPPVDSNGEFIQPPDVPEVAIIPVPPRIYEPQPQTIKPRVGATTPTPNRTVVAPPVVSGTRAPVVTPGTPAPTPPRTVVPGNGAPAALTPTTVRPGQVQPTTTRPPINTPNPPPGQPKPTAPAAAPTATTRPR